MRAVFPPGLSVHAYERYCERVGPADRDTVIAHVLSPEACVWLAWGAAAIYGHRGLNIYAKDGIVTTLTPESWTRNRAYVGLEAKRVQGRRSGRRPEAPA